MTSSTGAPTWHSGEVVAVCDAVEMYCAPVADVAEPGQFVVLDIQGRRCCAVLKHSDAVTGLLRVDLCDIPAESLRAFTVGAMVAVSSPRGKTSLPPASARWCVVIIHPDQVDLASWHLDLLSKNCRTLAIFIGAQHHSYAVRLRRRLQLVREATPDSVSSVLHDALDAVAADPAGSVVCLAEGAVLQAALQVGRHRRVPVRWLERLELACGTGSCGQCRGFDGALACERGAARVASVAKGAATAKRDDSGVVTPWSLDPQGRQVSLTATPRGAASRRRAPSPPNQAGNPVLGRTVPGTPGAPAESSAPSSSSTMPSPLLLSTGALVTDATREQVPLIAAAGCWFPGAGSVDDLIDVAVSPTVRVGGQGYPAPACRAAGQPAWIDRGGWEPDAARGWFDAAHQAGVGVVASVSGVNLTALTAAVHQVLEYQPLVAIEIDVVGTAVAPVNASEWSFPSAQLLVTAAMSLRRVIGADIGLWVKVPTDFPGLPELFTLKAREYISVVVVAGHTPLRVANGQEAHWARVSGPGLLVGTTIAAARLVGLAQSSAAPALLLGGGIGTWRDVYALIELGAAGVQVGTALADRDWSKPRSRRRGTDTAASHEPPVQRPEASDSTVVIDLTAVDQPAVDQPADDQPADGTNGQMHVDPPAEQLGSPAGDPDVMVGMQQPSSAPPRSTPKETHRG